MVKKIVYLLLAFGLGSCGKDAERGNYTLPVEEIDAELGRAILEAHQTFPAFIRKLQHPEPGETRFQVKYPFSADPGSGFRYEHLWLGDITYQSGRYYGTLLNQPRYVSGLKAGDRLPFWGDAITDWMYRKDGMLVGGRTIKYLIERIPGPDRDAALRSYYRQFKD
ncbi:MAG: DUF2314 domain-containing protein [Treponema sp.]|jgi:uncharacterized protein YegJ (DUF2314 family)|nr:DUF2314 domain-containing protein [Treponema sp.]